MTGFFSKLFGGKKEASQSEAEALVRTTLDGLFEKAGFELEFGINNETAESGDLQLVVEISGEDRELIRGKDGQMIDSLQLFLRRVVQHHFPEDRTNILIDCEGFREESNQALFELADKLKGIALEKGKSVYFRAMPPRDRKVIHQYLAGDQRVRSRSIGEGLYKKIKIYPVKNNPQEENA